MRLARAVSRRDLLKLTGGAVAAGAWFGVSGCSALGGSQQNGNSQVEKPKLRVGALPACELAVLHLAVRDGHFQEQGLDVEIVNAPDGDRLYTMHPEVRVFRSQKPGDRRDLGGERRNSSADDAEGRRGR